MLVPEASFCRETSGCILKKMRLFSKVKKKERKKGLNVINNISDDFADNLITTFFEHKGSSSFLQTDQY